MHSEIWKKISQYTRAFRLVTFRIFNHDRVESILFFLSFFYSELFHLSLLRRSFSRSQKRSHYEKNRFCDDCISIRCRKYVQ